jgi:signal transduction histidine kinase
LNNARDSTEERGSKDGQLSPIHLSTTVEYRSGDPDVVRLEICDQGVGISPEKSDRLFEAFYTTRDPEHGTGLGLSVSKSIVEAFGGEMEHSDGPDMGARAIVRLPAVETMEQVV